MKKYVLTGGPSVGKTTVIEILAARGSSIVPEAARLIIEEEKLKGSDILPWKNLAKFQDAVAAKQLELEAEAKGNSVFLDRSLIDGHAFCVIGNIPVPQTIFDEGKNRYEKIFFLESLGIYIEDGVRSRTHEDAEKIHEALRETYRTFGYEIISVPVLPPEERVDFILSQL